MENNAQVITIWFEKGGVGKTTVAYNLAAGLHRQGKKVLLIDIDPSAGSTKHAGLQPNALKRSLSDLLWLMMKGQELSLADFTGIIATVEEVDILPSNGLLESLEDAIRSAFGKEGNRIFEVLLKPLKSAYDYIIIDGAPRKSVYNISALAVADRVIMPIKANYLDFKGIEDAVDALKVIREAMNPKMVIEGLLITHYKQTKHTEMIIEALNELQEEYGIPTFAVKISYGIDVAEASLRGQSVAAYKKWGKQAKEFAELVKVVDDFETRV
ncbi:MAG: ParA family protein [Eubacteriales bacterium]|nr:ParA family protein [Eubacteriales bacterium]MDD3349943.1 ParA family protein [Eubacteriales bacterium]